MVSNYFAKQTLPYFKQKKTTILFPKVRSQIYKIFFTEIHIYPKSFVVKLKLGNKLHDLKELEGMTKVIEKGMRKIGIEEAATKN